MELQEQAIESKLYTPAAEPDGSDGATPLRSALLVRTKALYGVGEVANSIKTFTFGLFLLYFYTTVLGLPGTLVGIATSLNLLWDGMIDPLIGYLSDRSRVRFGRRHSFMVAGAIGMGASFFAIFSPPGGLSTGALFAWLMGTNILLRTANSIFTVPYHALGAELSRDYHERTSITGFRAAFALAGTMLAAASSFVLFFPNTTPGVDPKANPSGYAAMGLVFGLAMTLVGLITILGTLSRRSRAQAAPPAAPGESMRFIAGFMLTLRNTSFLVLTTASALFFFASVINATLSIHFLTYYAQITASSALSLFQLAFYIGALAGVAFWVRIAKKIDKHLLFSAATLVTASFLAAAYWLVGQGHLFGTGNLAPLAIGNLIAGYFASALWLLPASMLADVIDQDHLASGRRREGAFFGTHSLVQQLAAAASIFVTGTLVDHFAGLIPGQLEQTPLTIQRMALLFSILPAAIMIAAAVLILGYRLTQRRVNSIQSELAQRQIEG